MFRLSFVVLAVLQASACGILPTDPYAELSGTYMLESSDGNPVPRVVWDNDTSRYIHVTGSFTFGRDKTCLFTDHVQTTLKGRDQTVDTKISRDCTYRIAEGNRIVIMVPGLIVYDVTREGNVIVHMKIFRYRKS